MSLHASLIERQDLDNELTFGNRNALCGIISTAYEFASTEFQHRVWINQEGPEVSCYLEALSNVFDDYHAKDFCAGEAVSHGFSREANERLDVFIKTLDEFDDNLPQGIRDVEIVEIRSWQSVVGSAAAFLDSSVAWLDQNCRGFPMFKWSWAGRSFGGDYREWAPGGRPIDRPTGRL